MQPLGPRFSSVVHSPFVILGDTAVPDWNGFIANDRSDRPCAGNRLFRPAARPADFHRLGLRRRGLSIMRRTIGTASGGRPLPAITSGGNTGSSLIWRQGRDVAHELTHALGHFDFPEMPEWFDEGLASLHEDARFSDDHLDDGVPNWRRRYLLLACRKANCDRWLD